MSSIVVFSGGQDSTICLVMALQASDNVLAVSFNYGQKNAIESECARKIAQKLKVKRVVLDIPVFEALGDSALVTGDDVTKRHRLGNMPASYVPGRNAIFLTTAYAVALKRNARYIYTGISAADNSGYPDCSLGFITLLNSALNRGYNAQIGIQTPLIHYNKAEEFRIAKQLDILDLIVEDTHSCYNGVRDKLHKWGYGCGECAACRLRANGWKEAFG